MNIDSLLEVRASAFHDTLIIRTDLRIGRSFVNSDFDSALVYFNRAINLADEISMKKYPEYEGIVLNEMSEAYKSQSDYHQQRQYLRRAINSFIKAKLYDRASGAEYTLGISFSNSSKFDSAVYHFNQVVDRNLAYNIETRTPDAYNASGLNNYYLRRLDKAAEKLVAAIRWYQASSDTTDVFGPYINYALILTEQKDLEQAKKYYLRARNILETLDYPRPMQLTYVNTGLLLVKQDSLDKAIETFNKAWEIQQEMGWSGVGYYHNLAAVERKRNNHLKRHEYMVQAVSSIRETYAPMSKADVLSDLANAKLTLADSIYTNLPSRKLELYQEAVPLIERAWKEVVPTKSGNVRLKVADYAADLYSRLGRYKDAYDFSQLARGFSDTINDKARTNAIARMTTEFDTERIESENAVLQETQKRQSAQLKQQQTLLFGGLVVIVLIIAFVVVVQRNQIKLKKANARVEKSLEEKELLLKEIHHRVKNNLQVVSSLLDLQSRGIEDEEALATFMEGQNRVKAMALIHQKLYQNENLATIDFVEYAGQLMKELASLYPSAKGVKTGIEAGKNAHFDIDTAVPLGLILNELISNAYKYAFDGKASGELHVAVESLGEGKHQLTVADSGGGLPEGFDPKKAKSLGLRLVRRLAKQLYGSVTYSYEAGAKFVIIFTDTIERKAV